MIFYDSYLIHILAIYHFVLTVLCSAVQRALENALDYLKYIYHGAVNTIRSLDYGGREPPAYLCSQQRPKSAGKVPYPEHLHPSSPTRQSTYRCAALSRPPAHCPRLPPLCRALSRYETVRKGLYLKVFRYAESVSDVKLTCFIVGYGRTAAPYMLQALSS